MIPLKHVRRIAVVGFASFLAVTLTACSNNDGTEDTSAEETVHEPSATQAPANTPDTSAASEANDPAACLQGDWVADNGFFLASIREFGDEVNDVSGVVTLTFGEDGSLTADYLDWLITASVEGNTVTIHRNGIDNGTFSATATTVDLADTHIGSTMTLTAAGVDMSIDPAPISYANADYLCDQATASITTPDGTLKLKRA